MLSKCGVSNSRLVEADAMSKELHSGILVRGIVRRTELSTDLVGSSNGGVVEQGLFCEICPDGRKVLRERCSIEVGLQGGKIKNSVSRRDVNRDGDVDTLLCQYRTSDERG